VSKFRPPQGAHFSQAERTTGEAQLEETLLEIGKPVSHGPLHLFPLLGGAFSEEGLSPLEEALQEGTLHVEELGEGWS
jgi:hypothetical protein